MALSNIQQMILLTIAVFLVALPSIPTPGTFTPTEKYVIMALGLLGVAIKEGLGSKNTGPIEPSAQVNA